jgi:glutamate dehydrogenase (NADP+)
LIRPEATGYGATYFGQEMLKTKNESFNGKKVAISGSGNVAQYAAEKCMQLGAHVVTLSDSNGCVYVPNGITNEHWDYIMELKNFRRGRISEFAEKYNLEYNKNGKPWVYKVDIAMPCATQNELNGEDAKNLVDNKILAISEGANMPCTPEAITTFQEAKILFGPGKAANAGGVSTSGLEMAQNSQRYFWSRNEVDEKLKHIMVNIHKNAFETSKQFGDPGNYVLGANIAGFMKVANAMIGQGYLA